MKYLSKEPFSIPSSNGKMTDLEYSLRVGEISEEEFTYLSLMRDRLSGEVGAVK